MRGHTRRTTSDPTTGEIKTHVGIFAMLPWLWPTAAVVALIPVGLALWNLWGANPDPRIRMVAAVVLALLVVGLTSLTSVAARARGQIIRLGATASVATMGLWLLLALIIGPTTRPVFPDAWAVLAILSVAYPIVKAVHAGDGDQGGWGKLGDAIGHPGSRVVSAKRDGTTVRAVVEMAPGEVAADLGKKLENIGSFAGTGAGGARLRPDAGNVRRAELVMMTEDLLSKPIPYAGPQHPGTSIADYPIHLGNREDGAALELWLPGDVRDGRPASHVGISGITGAGKSVTGRILLADLLTRSDVDVWVADPVKGAQFLAPFRPYAARVAGSPDEARRMMHDLPALIKDRADHLGERDYEQWAPGCGLPFVVVHLEEAPALYKLRELVQVAQTGRSTGVVMIISAQRWTHKNIAVDVRSQVGTFMAFGCRDDDEQYGISSEAVQAGAAPQRWGNTRPGYCYLETASLTHEEWATPARVANAQISEIRAALAAHAPRLVDAGPSAETPTVVVEPAPIAPAADSATGDLRSHLERLVAAGRTEIRPADFDLIRARHDRSPAWITGQLGALVKEDLLMKSDTRGVYLVGGVAA